MKRDPEADKFDAWADTSTFEAYVDTDRSYVNELVGDHTDEYRVAQAARPKVDGIVVLHTNLDEHDFRDKLTQAITLISFVVEDVEGPRRRARADANRERLKQMNAHLKKDNR